MYKISINEKPLFLLNREEGMSYLPGNDREIINRYAGRPKMLHAYIDLLEKNPQYDKVVIFSPEVDQLFRDFCSLFKVIEAAGGVVRNDHNEILFIHRRGFWDLPKGKIDKGESPQQAAVREIQEETGLHDVILSGFLMPTWHVYEMDGRRILKKTWWYELHSAEKELIPQTEEDIEAAVWMSLNTFQSQPRKVYLTILDVLEASEKGAVSNIAPPDIPR